MASFVSSYENHPGSNESKHSTNQVAYPAPDPVHSNRLYTPSVAMPPEDLILRHRSELTPEKRKLGHFIGNSSSREKSVCRRRWFQLLGKNDRYRLSIG